MVNRNRSVRVISMAYCLLSGTALMALMANPRTFGVQPFVAHPQVLMGFLLAMTVLSLLLFSFKEVVRQSFIVVNIVMCLYLVGIMLIFRDPQNLPFVLLNLSAVLFFMQDKIKLPFALNRDFVPRKSILVVDDDEVGLRAVKGILLPNGFSVLTANSGEKGIQIAQMQRPDLIILDVILPGMKGREVCAQLKADPETQDIPVLFLTAKDSLDDIHAEMAAGGISHLTKPVSARTLLGEVRRIVKQYRG